MLGVFAPDVEWVEGDHDFRPHRGPGEVAAKVFGMVMDHFDEFDVVAEPLHDAGDAVVEGRAVGETKLGRILDAAPRACGR